MNRRATQLRVLRIGLRIPQYELALAARMDPARLSKIERGLLEPAADEVARLLRALGPEAEHGLAAAGHFLSTIERHCHQSALQPPRPQEHEQ